MIDTGSEGFYPSLFLFLTAAVTATAPTSNSSPLASAQSLRQRYGRLSPLRLGIFGLVSLGSHLLLLGLFRWAWQVQLATQPVGSPIGIDFVEVDLSDGSFEGQLPDESGTASIPGGKLSAAQLNELIANGEAASAIDNSDVSELSQNEVLAGRSSAPDTIQAATALEGSSQAADREVEQPRSWFPFGQPQENSEGGVLGDRPSIPPPNPSPATPQPSNNNSEVPEGKDSATSQAEAASNGQPGESPEAPQTENSAPINDAAADTTNSGNTESSNSDSPATDSTKPVTPSPNSSDEPSSSSEPGEAGAPGSGGGTTNSNPGRPNNLPPNQSNRPVSPEQTIQPDEASQPEPEQGGGEPENLPSEGGTEGNNPGGGIGNSEDESTGNPSGESGSGATPPADTEESAEPGGTVNEGNESSETVTRLGASLVVDEIQSRALNEQDVFTQLPQPVGNPLADGSQSVSSGRCAAQLAQLTPANYGQPVQLNLAVDQAGQVFYAAAADPAQAPTAVGQAIICLAKEWPFEPAKREIDEGNGTKVENAGAELFVTVTILLLE